MPLVESGLLFELWGLRAVGKSAGMTTGNSRLAGSVEKLCSS